MKILFLKFVIAVIIFLSIGTAIIFIEKKVTEFGSVEYNAIRNAHKDVKRGANAILCFGTGWLFSVFGVRVAHVIESTPGTSTFLWESPEYIAAYTEEYKSMGSSKKYI